LFGSKVFFVLLCETEPDKQDQNVISVGTVLLMVEFFLCIGVYFCTELFIACFKIYFL
jgi:hypothetical protein